MEKLQAGDKVKVKDRPEWPGRYRLAGTEGTIVELQEPAGYVMINVKKTEADVSIGTTVTFRSDAVEKI